jgi:hypothetical protein
MAERWDDLFDDLQAQAEALAAAGRAGEVAERTRAELSRLTLVDRLRTAVGHQVRLRCAGDVSPSGVLERVGAEWALLDTGGGREALVAMTAVLAVNGVGRLAAAPDAGVVESRLGLRSALRAVARDRSVLRVSLRDGTTLDGTVDRVGADFVELAVHPAGELRRRGEVREVSLIPTAALVCVERDR